MPKCPKCGAELLEVGYPDEFGFQRYRCPNGCRFEAPISWKLKNAIGYVLIATMLTLTLIFVAIPIGVALRVKSFVNRFF